MLINTEVLAIVTFFSDSNGKIGLALTVLVLLGNKNSHITGCMLSVVLEPVMLILD